MRVSLPTSDEHAPFQSNYISRVVGPVEPVPALERQRDQIVSQLSGVSEERAGFRYASGKWSIRELIGHISDTERILSYRLLRIGRGDQTPLPGFEEDDYVNAANFERRPLADLVEDWRVVRAATIRLVDAFDADAWTRLGVTNDSSTSARALLYIILGHVEHHRSVLEARYAVPPSV